VQYKGPDNLGVSFDRAAIADSDIHDVVRQWVPPKAILGTEYAFFEAPEQVIRIMVRNLWAKPPKHVTQQYLRELPRWLFRNRPSPAIVYAGPYRFAMAHLATSQHQYRRPNVTWAHPENIDFGRTYGVLPWHAVDLGFDGVERKDTKPFLVHNSYTTSFLDGTEAESYVVNYYLAPPEIRGKLLTGCSSPPLVKWVDKAIGIVATPSMTMLSLEVPSYLREEALVDISAVRLRSITLDIHPFTGEVLRLGRHTSNFKQVFLTDPTLYNILTTCNAVVCDDR